MASITQEQYAKLPKYARDLIDAQAAEIKTLDEQLALRDGGPDDTDTIANPFAGQHSSHGRPIKLPPGVIVQFQVGDNDFLRVRTDARRGKQFIEIQGSYDIAVLPITANQVYVHMIDWA